MVLYYVNSVQLKMSRSPKSLKSQLKYTINIYKTSNQKTQDKLFVRKTYCVICISDAFHRHKPKNLLPHRGGGSIVAV